MPCIKRKVNIKPYPECFQAIEDTNALTIHNLYTLSSSPNNDASSSVQVGLS